LKLNPLAGWFVSHSVGWFVVGRLAGWQLRCAGWLAVSLPVIVRASQAGPGRAIQFYGWLVGWLIWLAGWLLAGWDCHAADG